MKRPVLIILVLLALSLVAGCGGAAAPFRSLTGEKAPGIAVPMPAAAPTSAPAQPTMAAGGQRSATGNGGSLPMALDQAAAERMVVFTGTINLEVKDAEQTAGKIGDILKSVQGYIASRSLDRDSKGNVSGFIVIRVPSGSLEPVLAQIRGLGIRVIHEDGKSEDVTAQYTDLDARRKNLEAYEVELQQLLDTVREKTGKAEDILAVYNQLTDVRSQIDQIRGQQNLLQNTSSFATYTIQLTPHEEVQVTGQTQWDPGNTARSAINSLVESLQGLADAGIVVVLFVLPVLILIALPFAVVFLVARYIWRRRRIPKQAATA